MSKQTRPAFRKAACIVLFLFAASTLATGCGPTVRSLVIRLTPSATFVQPTETPPATQQPDLGQMNCAFVFSSREQKDVSTEVNQAFKTIGLDEVEVEASAYGEDCLDSETNQVIGFSAMQTDFYFNILVENTQDKQFLGEWIERINGVMAEFPPGKVPGPNPGYYGIVFTNGSETVNMWFPREKAENLIDEGVLGSELVDALQTP
jgi:hypothetical protein